MRSLLLCGALLALLAAPALANNWKNPKPEPRCDPTGTFLVDGKGKDFNGNDYTWTANAQNLVDILSKAGNTVLPPNPPSGFYLNGKVATNSAGQQGLVYAAWSYGATVAAEIKQTGFGVPAANLLAVTLNGKPLKPGRPLKLGALVTIDYPRDDCSKWKGCRARKVEIVVRPFIKIEITQPWIPPLAPGQKGAFAEHLEVKVTVTSGLQQPLSGYLGLTYTPPLKQQLIAAKIIPDVIRDVEPICGLKMETSFGTTPFTNGQLLTVAEVATAPTLAIKGAKPWDRYLLAIVDPDAPNATLPIYRSYLHGLWYDIPATGDLTDIRTKSVLTTGWEAPNPPTGSGTHRYVAVLYKQPKWGVKFLPIDPAVTPAALTKWNLNIVAWKKNLGEPIDVTWFTLTA